LPLAASLGGLCHPAFAAACFAGRRINPAAGDRLFDGRKTRAVQAGHFSSFGFDLIGFMGCFSTFMADEIRRLNAKVSVRSQKQGSLKLIDWQAP